MRARVENLESSTESDMPCTALQLCEAEHRQATQLIHTKTQGFVDSQEALLRLTGAYAYPRLTGER